MCPYDLRIFNSSTNLMGLDGWQRTDMVFSLKAVLKRLYALVIPFPEVIRDSNACCFLSGKLLLLSLGLQLSCSLILIRGRVHDLKPLKKYWRQVTHHTLLVIITNNVPP